MKLKVIDTERCVGCQSCMFACSRLHSDGGLANSRIEVKSIGGMARGFKVIACRACSDPPCVKVCPTGALTPRKSGGGGAELNADKCIGCGHCRAACLVGAIFWDGSLNKPMICAHCGYCAKYCPHKVLELEKTPGS